MAFPTYDRAGLEVGIVHIGVGGFHRSHQAAYLDRLLEAGGAREWGICGVGLLPGDAAMRDAMVAQDGLYTLLLKHPDGRHEARVIGSILRYLYGPDDPEAVLEVMAAPSTRIVSLTVTEGGYHIDPHTGAFDVDAPAVQADVAAGAQASGVFGVVTEALRRRRERGVPPFTVMSCDNLPGNGTTARHSFATFAGLVDPELGRWVGEEVAFPNSMVDRITPVTTDADRDLLRDEFGLHDAWPVVAEDFVQWVLEDHFPLGRPRWEEAGVQVVSDVEPYELMKLRLLNASHQALCYAGWLAGYRYAHEVLADPAFREFLAGYMREEGEPTVPPVPGIDLHAYEQQLLDRFANPEIADTLARLCADSSQRIPKWLVPVIRHNLRHGGEIRRSAAVVAAWARYAEGIDEQGVTIDVVDTMAGELQRSALAERADPVAFLRQERLFGDLATDERFVSAYLEARRSLRELGARRSLEALNHRLRPG